MARRTIQLSLLSVFAIAASTFVAVPPATAAAAITSGVELRTVATGLSQPVDITAPEGDPRLFVVEKPGRIRIIENGTVRPEPFLDIQSLVRTAGGEQGLLGLAFHPNYRSNGKFYVNYTSEVGTGDSTIAEYQVSADPNRADPASGRVLLRIDQPRTNHNGGQLQFGGGLLFASIGDGGSGGEPAQDNSSLLGKILRIDVDTTGPGGLQYGIPDGNPYADGPGRDEIWASGLRNPWRFSIDAVGGRIYIADVGQASWEEVNAAPLGAAGLDYGWNTMEGNSCYDPPGCFDASFTPPVEVYGHNDGCSITGGVVYRGNELKRLRGHYFYADLCGDWVRSFRIEGGDVFERTNWRPALGAVDTPVAFGTDGFGELYVASFRGSILRFSSTDSNGCDINGDGRADLTVGAPGVGGSGIEDAGWLHVILGSTTGPTEAGDQRLRPGVDGLAGTLEAEAAFGAAVTCADFNGDGFDDVAVGAPGDGEAALPGSVTLVYGSATGLNPASSARIAAGTGVSGQASPRDLFGSALATGDFNRDGYFDLAVGVPGARLQGRRAAGRVVLLHGSSKGLAAAARDQYHQNSPGIPGDIEINDRFGAALASGDFDGDGYDDLAVGAPGQKVAGKTRAGSLQLLAGSGAGLLPDVAWSRASDGITGKVKRNAAFGATLTSGNFDSDAFDDLAIGVPGMSSGAGEVDVLYGARVGVSSRDVRLRQGVRQVTGTARVGDSFGFALAAADIDADGWDDLVIGVPFEDVLGVADTGAVDIVFGERRGLVAGRFLRRTVSQAAVPGEARSGESYGFAVAVSDVNGDGSADVVAGAPGPTAGSGRVIITTGPVGEWHLDSPGIEGSSAPGDRFGSAL